jgi:hypothetical protein
MGHRRPRRDPRADEAAIQRRDLTRHELTASPLSGATRAIGIAQRMAICCHIGRLIASSPRRARRSRNAACKRPATRGAWYTSFTGSLPMLAAAGGQC